MRDALAEPLTTADRDGDAVESADAPGEGEPGPLRDTALEADAERLVVPLGDARGETEGEAVRGALAVPFTAPVLEAADDARGEAEGGADAVVLRDSSGEGETLAAAEGVAPAVGVPGEGLALGFGVRDGGTDAEPSPEALDEAVEL